MTATAKRNSKKAELKINEEFTIIKAKVKDEKKYTETTRTHFIDSINTKRLKFLFIENTLQSIEKEILKKYVDAGSRKTIDEIISEIYQATNPADFDADIQEILKESVEMIEQTKTKQKAHYEKLYGKKR